VKVLEVNSANSGLQRVLAATVISADSQSLSFRVGGSITSLPVNVGDRVTAGATVAELDQQPYRLAEKEARAQLAQADANYRNSRSQYRRTRELYSTEAASLSDLENAKASASSARANLALAKEGLNSSRLNLGYSKLLSPSNSCQIVSVPVTVNQNVSAGQTVVTTACGDQLRLRTVVPENLINAIEPAMPVSATLQTGGAALSGNVVEIAVSSNNSTGYAVEIALNSPSPAVKVGMAAEVTFELTGTKERLVVPLIAVLSDSKGKFVFVAEPLNEHFQIARQTVTTGELSNDGIEIVEGIKTGQRVVVAGMSRITEGMTVSLYSGAKP
jgi:RND family efflux transporter MFP subunit